MNEFTRIKRALDSAQYMRPYDECNGCLIFEVILSTSKRSYLVVKEPDLKAAMIALRCDAELDNSAIQGLRDIAKKGKTTFIRVAKIESIFDE